MKWSFLLLLAIGAACTMAMPVMELSTEDAGAEMIELAEQPKKVAPPEAKKQAPMAPKKAAPQVPGEKKKAPAVPKRSDKPHADHSEVHKPHGAPKAEEPKKATPKETKPKKAPVAPKKATPATPAVPKKAVPVAPMGKGKGKKASPKKAAPQKGPPKPMGKGKGKKASPKKAAPQKGTPKVKVASAKGLEPGSPAAAKESLQKEAIKAAGVHLGEAPQDNNDKPVPKMPCGYPFKACDQNEKAANTQDDPYDEGDTMTVSLKAHLAEGDQAHVDPLNTFATPELKLKKSEEIAKKIFDQATGQVSKMNQANDSKSAVEDIKTKFAKSIAYVKGLVESAKQDDAKKEEGGEASAEEESEEDQKHKAAVAAMASPLKDEDDNLVKSLPKKPTAKAIAAVEEAAKRHTKP